MAPDDNQNRFLAELAHDLRVPLSNIAATARLLLDGSTGELTAAQREVLDSLVHSSAAAIELVEALREYAQIEAGTLTSRHEEVPFAGVVESAVKGVAAMAAERQVRIEIAAEGDPPVVRGDLRQLRRVLTNLLANAVAHSPRGAMVSVAVAVSDAEVVVTVSDQGSGIPEDERERIFEPYVRLENARAGTGLGLSICRGLAELHGGRVAAVDSERGARFELRLPAAPTSAAGLVR
ncbi:MAG: HAMP domain-containing histidine kinase [Armatimonadetes bacterium]|nr:HAMP domain-containing histidine kinase [Armatimonadota bacterium]